MLGERIRKLRKQKKLTLEELAGTKLTKGMLSLIENNKANPSMESLTYIAERLDIEVSQLLNEMNFDELREVLDEAEKLFAFDFDEDPEKYKKLIHLIEPFVPKLNHGYVAARLLELYGYCLYWEKKFAWQEPINAAALLYDQMNITPKRTSIGIFRGIVYLIDKKYEKALEIILYERNEIEQKHAFIDPISRLDLDYHEAILHFAVGDTNSAKRVMDEAISFSQKNKTFYLIDDLYRLAAAYAMMAEEWELHDYYLKKLKQYAEFSDDKMSKASYKLFYLESLNTVKHDYKRALKIIDELSSELGFNPQLKYWLYLERGKALHGLAHYEEAIHYFDKVQIPTFHHHPFDLSQFYLAETYKALCFNELGKTEEAISSAKKAVELFDHLPDSPYKEFSFSTYQKLIDGNREK